MVNLTKFLSNNLQQKNMAIKRYNQGFGKFGPLEQCKDGKLVFHEDANKRFKEKILEIYALEEKVGELNSDKQTYLTNETYLILKLANARGRLLKSMVMILAMFIVNTIMFFYILSGL